MGLLLLALRIPAIRQANEVEPYFSDVAFILLVYLIGFGLLSREPSRTVRVAAALGGAAIIWFSHVTVFGLAAAGPAPGWWGSARFFCWSAHYTMSFI